MFSSLVVALLVGLACGRATQTYSHVHHASGTATPDSTPYPTGHTPTLNATPTRYNNTHNGTYSNTSGITWLPSTEKVRGVNLGSQFIIEPWMAYDEWKSMGCDDSNDEWACVQKLGQDAADRVFAEHWASWITEEDIYNISNYGLNVIRVPVGFWMKEDLVQEGEYYPRGAVEYLDQLVGWAADAGLYVIMDLHGGPGSQYPNQQFTGHGVNVPGFYTPSNYERAINFLEWMTKRIHLNKNYRTTGVLGVMNEPVHASTYPDEAEDMLKNFYAAAYRRIRNAERSIGVYPHHQLKIQYMGVAWGSGDPTSYLSSNAKGLLFDDHRYYKWDTDVQQSKDGYIYAACSDNRGGSNIIMGEWSLAISDDYQSTPEFAIGSDTGIDMTEQKAWYKSFWAAQVETFERSGGWIFWTWKCNWINGQDEWRWCYQSAVANGVIPVDATSAISLSPCSS